MKGCETDDFLNLFKQINILGYEFLKNITTKYEGNDYLFIKNFKLQTTSVN